MLPAAILTEALAQTGAVLILAKPENKSRLIYFMGIDRMRYRRAVVEDPNDPEALMGFARLAVLGCSSSPSAVTDVGAATWGNGTTGITGTVSVTNSLVGSAADDIVGDYGIAALKNPVTRLA
jgi:hypothetical protein